MWMMDEGRRIHLRSKTSHLIVSDKGDRSASSRGCHSLWGLGRCSARYARGTLALLPFIQLRWGSGRPSAGYASGQDAGSNGGASAWPQA